MSGRDHAELCTGEQRTRAWIQSAGGPVSYTHLTLPTILLV